MEVKNLLVAGSEKGIENFPTGIKRLLENSDKIRLREVDLVHSVKEIDEEVGRNKYDALIAFENVNDIDQPIGQGSIKAWRELDPNLRIILIVNDKERLLSNKVRNLFRIGVYNVCTKDDLIDEAEHLLSTGRTEAEAIKYYGLEEKFSGTPNKQAEVQSEDTSNNNKEERETFFNDSDNDTVSILGDEVPEQTADSYSSFNAKGNEQVSVESPIREEIREEVKEEAIKEEHFENLHINNEETINKEKEQEMNNEERTYSELPATRGIKYAGFDAKVATVIKGDTIILDCLGNDFSDADITGKKVLVLLQS